MVRKVIIAPTSAAKYLAQYSPNFFLLNDVAQISTSNSKPTHLYITHKIKSLGKKGKNNCFTIVKVKKNIYDIYRVTQIKSSTFK